MTKRLQLQFNENFSLENISWILEILNLRRFQVDKQIFSTLSGDEDFLLLRRHFDARTRRGSLKLFLGLNGLRVEKTFSMRPICWEVYF